MGETKFGIPVCMKCGENKYACLCPKLTDDQKATIMVNEIDLPDGMFDPVAVDPADSIAGQLDEANEYRDHQNRIEGLRAASRIVAGIYSNGAVINDASKDAEHVDTLTTGIAKTFATYLETGE